MSELNNNNNNADEEKTSTDPFIKILNDGNKIPMIGFGTYKLGGNTLSVRDAVKYAIEIGYRHIDTAIFYGNEKEVGEGIKDAKIDRKELFITTKLLWYDDHHETGKGQTERAVDASLKRLGCGYIDLYLIHSPRGKHNIRTYQALLKCKEQGKIRSVGCSNFGVHHLKALEAAKLPLPAVNQIELHPWLQQTEIVRYCRAKNIAIQSYSPLVKGKKIPNESKPLNQQSAEHKKLIDMKKHYDQKSVAQILLRWNLQSGHIVIVKSSTRSRIAENLDILNWTLNDHDFAVLNAFECGYHCTWDPTSDAIAEHDGDQW
eukprot:CAMPEP_0202726494 /NCGR_PEP_ID=MMETSP1385-20130828/184641_1 /ASSEMBLY_ACC=CAM_ASM_000861 /TAXON_ID=933848 /ORGANISM="Elphidium margaritaceum" /LENGTH=316 /DNA_ID=CAMNT_0049392715 /DNA_START=8 /DNA_END=958 /DNA_ORIENTATION=-